MVVPAYNAAESLSACLGGVNGQLLPSERYEVVVVDDGSSDNSGEIADRLGASVIAQSNRGAGAARNTGWQAARGRWVAFTDSDCVPARTWLSSLLDAAERARNGDSPALGAAGKMVGYRSETAAARFVDLFGSLDAERHLAHPLFPFPPSGNVLYRRDALAASGGFDARYRSYEACDLHQRLVRADGGAFVFEPHAVVLHRHRAGWRDYWRQQIWYGKGYGQFMWHHRDEVRWTILDEFRDWGRLAGLAVAACRPGSNDEALVRRGRLVKGAAQRLGFDSTFWNPMERSRW